MTKQSGQSLVEWAISAFVLLLFALGIIAVGQIVSQYVALRSATSQAAFAAARAPSADDAQRAADDAARQAVQGSQLSDFHLALDTAGFERGGTLTATAEGYVSLGGFPIVSQVLGQRVKLTWQAHALIEPYRSRAA
jgi:membrane-associated protease RseP (regulator of RpoE activity)